MADVSQIKLPNGDIFDLVDDSKSTATNWVNGSATNSVRTTSSATEGSGYTMGAGAVAEGDGTKASGNCSHAEGGGTTASGYCSHAEGAGTTASGGQSHAEGGGTTASSSCAHAEGGGTTASGQNSHAEGGYTTASGGQSHAEGSGTMASGEQSHAEGVSTIANHRSQHVFGEFNLYDTSAASAAERGNYVEIVGNGTSISNHSNARTLDWSGNEVLAGKLTVGVAGTNSMDVATVGQIPTVPSDIVNTITTTAGAHTAISNQKGNVSFNVPTTAAHVGIKFGYTTSGNNRAVLQDSSGNLYVTQKDDNTNTTYTLSGALSSHKFTSTLTAGGSGSGTSTSEITFVAGSNVTLTDDTTNKKITIAATDTTYSSKAAASGGTDVSLVTTGEKYTWNSKTSNTGTITSVKTTAGAHTAINTTSGAVSFNVPTTAAHVGIKFGYTTSGNNRAVLQDSSGNLYVTQKDDNTTYSSKAAANGGTDVSLVTTGEKYTWNSKTSNTGTVTSVAATGSGGITISGSPITSSGTLTIGLNLSTAINGLSEGASPAQLNDYAVVQYAGGGTTTTTYHRRKLTNLIVGKAVADQNGLRIDTGYLKLTGGQVTGPTTFGDSVSIDDLNAEQLVVSGSASVANNLQVNTINGVAVGSSPKFTDNNTTYNFSGTTFYSGNSGNAEHNANNALKNGNYYYSSNGPATDLGASTADGALYVQSYSDSWVGQIAQDYRNGGLFVRGKNNGTWQNWQKVYDTAHKPTAADIGAAASSHTHSYLPLSGGTMTGALNTANGVANKIGDDVQLGDFNVAGTLGIQGVNGTTGIALIKKDESWASSANLAKITYDGSDVSVTKPVHGFISAAHYGGTGSTTKIKIKINSTATWMLSFVVTLYQGYRATKVMISGYQYGSNYWYQPKARLIADSDGTETISVYFGYDSANNLWVGFDGGNYTGVTITDVVNGYTQITDYSNLFTISNVSALGGTTQTTVTAASKANYANSAGSASSATVATRLAAFSSASTAMAWGNQTGTVLGCYATTGGGGLGFRDNNPASGQVSMTIDGTIYIKEGAVSVGDAIKSITRDGTTFTYTTLWGNTGTFTQQDSNTTYSSLAAASGGTAVSLVTTGEKYTWNSKTSNTGTITSVKTTAGAHTAINTTSGAVSFNVPTTAAHVGIKFGYTTSGNNRAVLQDSSGNLYVTQKDDNSDTKVTQTVTTSNASYPILMAPNGQTATTTTTGYFSTTLNWNPSTKIFYVSSGTTTGNIYIGLATNDALYTAINNLGWVSAVIV